MGILSSIINAGVQSATNSANRRENQLNREFNERMMNKQMQFEADMWNKQNEYNDPSAWRKRMENAGFNPGIAMMNGSGLGQATSSPRGTAASAVGSVPMQSPQFDFSVDNILNMMTALSQKKSIDADVQRKNIENAYLAENLQSIISNRNQDTRGKIISNNLADETYNLELRRRRSEAAIVEAEESRQEFYNSMAALDVNHKRIVQSWLPEIIEIQQELLKSQKRLTDKQIDKVVEEKLLISEQKKKLVMENGALRNAYEEYKGYIKSMYQFMQDYNYTGDFTIGGRTMPAGQMLRWLETSGAYMNLFSIYGNDMPSNFFKLGLIKQNE